MCARAVVRCGQADEGLGGYAREADAPTQSALCGAKTARVPTAVAPSNFLPMLMVAEMSSQLKVYVLVSKRPGRVSTETVVRCGKTDQGVGGARVRSTHRCSPRGAVQR